ncbi:MAG: hypothetical protein OEW08_14890, partial [Gammaproteobacteria bacterium]|nr:hypothetical protein [Gammaproteobacteria bacterium]
TACATHTIKTDDTFQFAGESAVTLVNSEILYVKNTRLDGNGLIAADYYTDVPVRLTPQQITSVSDIDYWRGAKYGALIIPTISFLALYTTMPPETHSDFTLPNALIALLASAVTVPIGAVAGGMIGYTNTYQYPTLPPANNDTTTPITPLPRSNFRRTPLHLALTAGGGYGALPSIPSSRRAELKQRGVPVGNVGYHAGYNFSSTQSAGLAFDLLIGKESSFNGDVINQFGSLNSYRIRRSIASMNAYYAYIPNVRGLYYQGSVGIASYRAMIDKKCCDGLLENTQESHILNGFTVGLETGYRWRLQKHTFFKCAAASRVYGLNSQIAATAAALAGIEWM